MHSGTGLCLRTASVVSISLDLFIGGRPVTRSPVNVCNLQQLLRFHHDQELVQFILHGFCFGFDIGFKGILTPGADWNLKSASQFPGAISEVLNKEVTRGLILGPFDVAPYPTLHVSPLGAVPKKDGTHRLIMDLSSPQGCSINEGIDKDQYSVQYTSFDDAVDMIVALGRGAYMAKIDINMPFDYAP